MSTHISYLESISTEILANLAESPNISRTDLCIMRVDTSVKLSRSEYALPLPIAASAGSTTALIGTTDYDVPKEIQAQLVAENPHVLLEKLTESYPNNEITYYVSPSETRFWITVSFGAPSF